MKQHSRPFRPSHAAGLLAACVLLVACEPAEPPEPGPYDKDFPAVGYASREPGGRLGQFAAAVADGTLIPGRNPDRGYFDDVLDALDIDASSQALVFSRTSLQTPYIDADEPRAIYFNDDTYVAWIPDAPTIEISGYDPELGPVFYTLRQGVAAADGIQRQLGTCLRCHDTYGLSGGGVPRFLLGSGYIGPDGELVSHEAWILTSPETPFRSRWGGWYVTGRHDELAHLGNVVVGSIDALNDVDALRVGTVDDVAGLFDASRYRTTKSDIVALLVLEHQVETQNQISRLRFETAGGFDAAASSDTIELLVRDLLMVDDAPLTTPLAGNSGFTAYFEAKGPFDDEGRSLRQLDLKSRVFRYPLSYLIYSAALQALPPPVKGAVYARIRQILSGAVATDGYERLSADDRDAITGILRATLPEVLAD
jgi:hypothetical protein